MTAGLQQGLARNSIEPAAVSLLSHATTVVTNALLAKKGARTGFVTTSGLRDVLELRRSPRADLYDLFQDAPAVLVPRRWRYEITERLDGQGNVVTSLKKALVAWQRAPHPGAGHRSRRSQRRRRPLYTGGPKVRIHFPPATNRSFLRRTLFTEGRSTAI